MTKAALPGQNLQWSDPQTGLLTPAAWAFVQNLWNRTGGNDDYIDGAQVSTAEIQQIRDAVEDLRRLVAAFEINQAELMFQVAASAFMAGLLLSKDAPAARTALGLGTIATQNANAVAVTGGVIDNTPIGGTTPADVKATDINSTGVLRVAGVAVVGPRDTGWGAMTGSTNKATVYDTATVTLPQLAGRVMALQAAITNHGLLGT